MKNKNFVAISTAINWCFEINFDVQSWRHLRLKQSQRLLSIPQISTLPLLLSGGSFSSQSDLSFNPFALSLAYTEKFYVFIFRKFALLTRNSILENFEAINFPTAVHNSTSSLCCLMFRCSNSPLAPSAFPSFPPSIPFRVFVLFKQRLDVEKSVHRSAAWNLPRGH